jgi:hypothetical protein
VKGKRLSLPNRRMGVTEPGEARDDGLMVNPVAEPVDAKGKSITQLLQCILFELNECPV